MWVVGQRVFAEFEPELGLGVVVGVVGPRLIEVSFPGAQLTRRYAQQSAPLRRLVLSPRQRVKSKDGRNHTIQTAREVNGLFLYQSDKGDNFWEQDLDHVIEDETPLARFFLGQWAHPKTFRLREQAWNLRAKSLEPDLRGLVGPRVALLPHQLSIASEIARRELPRVLLADEVGLGKTIEAGLIFSSLKALGRADRVLILVPEALEHQWLAEMYRRFGEMFTLVDEVRSEQEQLSQGKNAFQMNQRIICSLAFLEQNLERLTEAAEEAWDLVIVDEAHRMGWSEDDASVHWDMVRVLSGRARGLLLLTATPQRQGLKTQFGLLHLVDPHRFPDFKSFERQSGRMKAVAALARQLQEGDKSSKFVSELKACFPRDKEVAAAIDKYVKGGSSEELLHQLVDRHGTGRVLIRNRRSKIQGFPERQLHPIGLDVPGSWVKWLKTLNAEKVEEEELYSLSAGLEDIPEKAPTEEWFEARASSLLSLLESLGEEKVLLICSSAQRVRDLQEWLRNASPVRTAIFDEDLEIVERDRQAAWFGEAKGARVLLCSEIGGEGRNFQFCHHLFLFDLPLHPDVLEQRIGRLDRIGQRNKVKIYVPFFKDTPEEVLLNWYAEGLELFQRPWNGAMLGQSMIDDLQATLRDFLPKSKGYEKRRNKLTKLLQNSKKRAAEIRQEQQESVDLLVDINSFNQERGIALSKKIREVDKSPELTLFLESAFDYFGVESEKLDDKGSLKLTAHSMTFVESFPGLSPVGDLVATSNRDQALTREELALLSWEHPVVQGALSLVLEGGVGRISGGIWPAKKYAHPLVLELLYVLQATAPSHLEIEHDLPVRVMKIFVTPQGQRLEPLAGLESAALQAIPLPIIQELMKGLRERLPEAIAKASSFVTDQTASILKKAVANRTARFEKEQARLKHLAEVNPLVPIQELAASADRLDQGVAAIKATLPRLDAIRLIVHSPI